MVLRRWARPGWDIDDPDYTAAREIAVLSLLERARMPTPRLVAADPNAVACDVPALLITKMPGRPPARIEDIEAFLRQLAEMLVRIHDVDPGDAVIRTYQTYVDLDNATVPWWLEKAAIWSQALDVARQRHAHAPAETRFIHRDYYPGNSLWSRGLLTGIIDWTQASIGPPEMDVGHMRWNLAATYGEASADRFRDLYEGAVGHRLPALPQWDLITLLDLVFNVSTPIPPAELAPLEAHATAALAR